MFRAVAALLVVLWLIPVSAWAVKTQHVEDFTTTQFRDSLNTTAFWDTVAGELKLFPDPITPLGFFDTSGDASGVAVSGNFAFVADLGSGLQVIDITTPSLPTLAGTFVTAGSANAVTVAGDRAFVASDVAGLEIVDITTPGTPVLTGTFNTAGQALDVAVAGDLAFVADGDSGLVIINIQNTAAPTLVGRFAVPGVARGVTVAADRAFVAALDSGLVVVDITTPASPTLAGRFLSGQTFDVAVDGTVAYVADGLNGVLALDISNVATMAQLGSFNTSGTARAIDVDGDIAHVADGAGGLVVLDITDPANPAFVESLVLPDAAKDVTMAGVVSYVADALSGLRVLGKGSALTTVAVSDSFDSGMPFPAGRIVVSGNHLYARSDANQIRIYDISNPAQPFLASSFSDPAGVTSALAAEGNLLFTGLGSGFGIFDISNPLSPTLVTASPVATTSTVVNVAVSGDLAFVASAQTVQIFNIQNPVSPTLVGTASTFPHSPGDIEVEGDLMFLAASALGVSIWDISNPAAPALLATHDTPGSARQIEVRGNFVYVADASALTVVDVSNPSLPVTAATDPSPSSVVSVAVSGNHLFLPDVGLRTYDITDPANPVNLGVPGGPAGAFDVAVSGDFAFMPAQVLVPPFTFVNTLNVVKVFDRRFIAGLDAAQSTILDDSVEDIIQARISPTETGTIQWRVSNDAGVNFTAVTAGEWASIDSVGGDFVWDAKLLDVPSAGAPVVSSAVIEWRFDFPVILSVTDIGNDQGGQVRLTWANSGHDVPLDPLPATEYAIFRRIDPLTVAPPGGGRGDEPSLSQAGGMAGDGEPVVSGTLHATAAMAGWDFVATVPAFTDAEYSMVVPTLKDSTVAGGIHHSVYRVRAVTATPGTFFDSPPDSGFSLDNLAPSAPGGLLVSGGVLSWDEAPEPDFNVFTVYGSSSPVFDAGAVELGLTATPSFDISSEPFVNFFVTATDSSGNEGAASGLNTPTSIPDIPQIESLAIRVHPNPFNPVATITYDVPAAGSVTIAIYDVQGRLVENLLDNEHHLRGVYSIPYRAQGATGVLFARIEAGGRTQTVKMVLLK